jgi:maltoporin
LFQTFFVDIDDDRNTRGLTRGGHQQCVVNSIVQKVGEVGFDQAQKKQNGREDDTIKKDQSDTFPVSSNGLFSAFERPHELKYSCPERILTAETQKSDQE